jgi:hypothetical protein
MPVIATITRISSREKLASDLFRTSCLLPFPEPREEKLVCPVGDGTFTGVSGEIAGVDDSR